MPPSRSNRPPTASKGSPRGTNTKPPLLGREPSQQTLRPQTSSDDSGYIPAIRSNRPSTSSRINSPTPQHLTGSPLGPTGAHRSPASPHPTKLAPNNLPSTSNGESSSAPHETPKQKPRLLRESWDGLVTVQSPVLDDDASEVQAITSDPLRPAAHEASQPYLDDADDDSNLARDSASDMTIAASYHTSEAQVDPFTDSQTMLQTIGHQLAVNDREHVLLALKTLREGVKQQRYQLIQCL